MTLYEKLDSTTAASICRGVLSEILEDGTLMVSPETTAADPVPCDLLLSGATAALDLRPGAQVLYAPVSDTCERGCVLGVIGSYAPPRDISTQVGNNESTTLTIRRKEIEIIADSKLVLRCGEGALTITEDGTVIIKGARMLSRAKGTNKIKGAAVQIN